MLRLGRKRVKRAYGLDVGNGAIKLVELVQEKPDAAPRLARYLIKQTPPEVVQNGVVRDSHRLQELLRQMLHEFKARRLQVTTVLTGQTLIVRQVEVPTMPEAELRSMLELQADQYFGMPADKLSFDFQVLAELPGERSNLFLVGQPKQPILDFADLLQKTGIGVNRVDIEPLAAYRSLYPQGAGQSNEGFAILDLGAGTTNLSIFHNDLLQMVRVISVAGNDLTQAVAEGMGLDFAEAEKQKISYGLQSDSPIYASLGPVLARLLRQVAMTLEYYQVENRNQAISTLWLVGGNGQLLGLTELLEQQLQDVFVRLGAKVPQVKLGNPCGLLSCEAINEETARLGPVLAVAIGLALGEMVNYEAD